MTILSGSVCRSINCTGYTGTLNGNGQTLTIGDATAGASDIALKFVAGMTYSTAGNFLFASTSTTVQEVDFAGKTTAFVTFNGVGGSWQYTGAHTATSGSTVTLTNGTLNTNGQTCSWGIFSSSNTNTRVLTLGASSIAITGSSATAWNSGTATNMTLNANTSTITLNGSAASFAGGGLTYNTVVISGSATSTVSNVNTFANLTRTGTAAKTDALTLSNNQTVTGTFTCNGNSATNRILVQSAVVGSSRSITAATVSVTNTDFQDITGAGAGSWDLSAITGGSGDCGGNSGITFTTPATQTATGTASFAWSTHGWTSRVPLPQDDVVINNAFIAGRTVTADMPRLGKNIDFTGTTGTPAWLVNTSASMYGSLTLISDMTMAASSALTFSGRSTHTITMAGIQYLGGINITAPNGTYTLQDAFSTNSNFIVNNGTFISNNFTITCLAFLSSGTATRAITLGTSTINISSTSTTHLTIVSTGLTFSGASSTIVLTGSSATTKTFAGGGVTYGTLSYTLSGSTGALVITGANTFNTINFSDVTNARLLRFPASTTTTITGTFNVNGTSGKLMSIDSSTGGTPATLSKTSGIVSCNYLSIQDSTATGGAGWYAGANSTNVSGNTGWIFTAPPAGSGGGGELGMKSMTNLLNLRSL